ncbi:sulfatase (plasmid) [Alteromonas stellipolaris]|uniref:Sulfatase n=1 Tax=Alteromonas stellipolaris TaxID=233316 RepID=A0ABM5YQA8_9ALTE|nr:sulfatase [Alteromonas stellipolaris]
MLFNLVLWVYVINNIELSTFSGVAILSSVFAIVFVFTFTFCSFLALISLQILKGFVAITTVINAIAIYYMTTYQVVLDRTMMGNVFNTRYSESVELLSISLLFTAIIVGLLPAWILIRPKVETLDRIRVFRNALIGLITCFTFLYVNAASWLWIDKHASVLGGKILPWSYIINSARHYTAMNKSTEGQLALPSGKFINDRKTVFILVIGETARADNFSLYGYPKTTTPKLAQQQNLLVLSNTKSCTTYTTGALACMLAPTEKHINYEPLPTYLTRHGIEVEWRTNNWGEPATDVSRYVEANELRSNCTGDGCHLDEVLLTNLSQTIESSEKQKILLILHTKGSHGPSYYKRYSQEFNQFTPVCRDEEISKCNSESLVNAYDNTILYTDHFLVSIIKKLQNIKGTSTAMMYISDHGESLGEYGLYLHGTPYTFAPDYQKNIPFLIWASDEFLKQRKLDLSKLKQAPSHSQFNVFHTILGAFELDSPIYKPELDVLSDSNEKVGDIEIDVPKKYSS